MKTSGVEVTPWWHMLLRDAGVPGDASARRYGLWDGGHLGLIVVLTSPLHPNRVAAWCVTLA